MPWLPQDAAAKDSKASTPKKKRQWADVANSVLKRTDDEGRALGDDERTELRDSLAGIKAMIDAARSFRATLATSGCDLEALAASYRTPHQ